MANPGSSMPRPSLQPPTVDFIDNYLPKLDPAFVSPPAHYDIVSNQYIPNSMYLASSLNNGDLLGFGTSHNSPNISQITADAMDPLNHDAPPRPEITDTQAMAYWNAIFPEAMDQFKLKAEPHRRPENYRIRGESDWDGIYSILEMARGEYNNEAGISRRVRKVWRKAADNIDPATQVANAAKTLMPQDVYASTVLGAVVFIFQAIGTAASVRKETLEGIDGIVPILSDVELFLSTFPKDKTIRDASIQLTVNILVAIEHAIGFFISSEFVRAFKAAALAGSYEKGVRESLKMVNTQSRSLMEEAIKSHIHESRYYSIETQKMLAQIQQSSQQAADRLNSIERLLADHKLEREKLFEAYQALQLQNSHLVTENVILRTHSPLLQGCWAPPSPQPPKAIVAWSINQRMLRQVLSSPDLDLADMAFVSNQKSDLPSRQLVRAEQIASETVFQEWIVSPTSAKLLVQWNRQPPKTIAGISSLSVFCRTLAQALRAKQGFIWTVWFSGRHTDAGDAGPYVGGRAMLASLIDQILRQYAFDLQPLSSFINLAGLQAGDSSELLSLLRWLVRQLPRAITLFCIIDSVALLEREEHRADALPVLSALLSFTKDSTLPAAIKVLFTSTLITDIVGVAFEQENLILNVEGLAQMVWAPSEERMTRELEGGFYDATATSTERY